MSPSHDRCPFQHKRRRQHQQRAMTMKPCPIIILVLLAFAKTGISEASAHAKLSGPKRQLDDLSRRISLHKPAKITTRTIFQLRNGGKPSAFPAQIVAVEEIPRILKPWISLYRAVPCLYLPLTKLDIAFTLASGLFLTFVDLASAKALTAAGWPAGSETRSVAGSLATIFHSTCLCAGLGGCLLTQPYSPSEKMERHPRWWQDAASALIQFCTGYMLYDAAVQFLVARWMPGVGPVLSATDCMFLGHHAATALYMTSARLIEGGHMSAMILMFFGEITAPLMNINRIFRIATDLDFCCHGSWLPFVRQIVEYIFSLAYVVFRVFVGPICATHLTYDLLFTRKGRENVPVGLSFIWLSMCWGVMIGSVPWITSAIKVLRSGLFAR